MNKILHVWNTAAVGQTLAKYQNRLGYETRVICRKALNPYSFEGAVNKSVRRFYIYVIRIVRKYDIIHIHSFDKIIPFLRRFYRNKTIVLTYHGSDIRNLWEEKKKYWSKADFVSVATPDLLVGAPANVQYIENPVDTDHFSRSHNYIPGCTLFVLKDDSEKLLRLAEIEIDKRGLDRNKLTVQNRSEYTVPYLLYPRFLEVYEYYIDIKECFGKINPAMSLTALQFLVLGGKVIYLGEEYEGLPEIYNPERIAKLWIDIYEQIKQNE